MMCYCLVANQLGVNEMREIKFRAFIEELRTMHEVLELHGDGGVMVDGYKYPFGYEYPLKSDCIFLMQYTGLKDKNGVEIYEGDIVNHNGIGVGYISYNDKHAAYKIVFKGTTRKWLIDMLEREIREIEVIGNIYENPKLINQ